MSTPPRTLFDAPFQRHSDTSRDASLALRADPERLGRLEAAVLAFVTSQGSWGATDLEVQTALVLDGSTQRPRRVRLVERGWVVDSGLRRRTPSGRTAVVWCTPEAKERARHDASSATP